MHVHALTRSAFHARTIVYNSDNKYKKKEKHSTSSYIPYKKNHQLNLNHNSNTFMQSIFDDNLTYYPEETRISPSHISVSWKLKNNIWTWDHSGIIHETLNMTNKNKMHPTPRFPNRALNTDQNGFLGTYPHLVSRRDMCLQDNQRLHINKKNNKLEDEELIMKGNITHGITYDENDTETFYLFEKNKNNNLNHHNQLDLITHSYFDDVNEDISYNVNQWKKVHEGLRMGANVNIPYNSLGECELLPKRNSYGKSVLTLMNIENMIMLGVDIIKIPINGTLQKISLLAVREMAKT